MDKKNLAKAALAALLVAGSVGQVEAGLDITGHETATLLAVAGCPQSQPPGGGYYNSASDFGPYDDYTADASTSPYARPGYSQQDRSMRGSSYSTDRTATGGGYGYTSGNPNWSNDNRAMGSYGGGSQGWSNDNRAMGSYGGGSQGWSNDNRAMGSYGGGSQGWSNDNRAMGSYGGGGSSQGWSNDNRAMGSYGGGGSTSASTPSQPYGSKSAMSGYSNNTTYSSGRTGGGTTGTDATKDKDRDND